LATVAFFGCEQTSNDNDNTPQQTTPSDRSGAWFETVWAEWTAASSGTARFSVKYRLNGGAWKDVDDQLVRIIDTDSKTWRVDVPGLLSTSGSIYDLRVLDSNNKEVHLFTGLAPKPYDRQGYAFALNTVNGLTTTTGGYNADGTVPSNAEIVYVTHDNMNTVLTAGKFSNKTTRPVIIRFIGQVGYLNFYDLTDQSNLPAAVSNPNRMYTIQNSQSITIEGIGPDAYLEGWGLGLTNNTNIVVRNLKFDHWYDDAVYINASSNTSHNISHSWVTHNTFGYGLDRYHNPDLTGEADHVKGDGATDIGNGSTHFTVSYNIYRGSGKSMLIGGGASAAIGHGTIHHNWFASTSERTPRVRNGWIHVFNNLYDYVGGDPGGGAGYGIAAGHRANIVSEGNTFIHTYRPYIVSGEGSSNAAGANIDGSGNTLSNDAPGVIITSLYAGTPSMQVLTGRTLVPDALDDWSKNPLWYFADELTLSGGPTFTNDQRPNGLNYIYTFVPFHTALSYRTDGSSGVANIEPYGQSPNLTWAAQPAISATLIGLGVESAANGADRVRQQGGVMPR
jgi:pectate lyase